ncbi:fimbrial biogenesis outer membrane usher protein [Acinetobacter johnsonii]|nr:fimbrial biogenesis outer membrane usher protein [Acinetobacter johnsonii]
MKNFKYNVLYILMFMPVVSHSNNITATRDPQGSVNKIKISESLGVNEIEKIQVLDASNFAFFNPSSLYGQDNRNINLDSFKSKSTIQEGTYYVQLNINKLKVTDTKVKFIKKKNDEAAFLCLDKNLLNYLDLDKKILSKLPDEDCLSINDIHTNAYYDMDSSKLVLNLYIPQAIKNEHPEGYINPKLFDEGVNSGFISYNYNTFHNDDRTTQYLGLSGGVNFNGWYFRHQGNFDSNDSGLGDYTSYENVLHTDILPIYSRLSLGQFNTQNYQLDSLPIVGVQIASDQTMLPWSQQNYSPIIENFANSNAVVKVFQNGMKIYEQTVPAGPFKLTDLGSIGYGDLIVEIEENSGEKKTYTVPLQQNVYMIKPGRYNYSASIGNYHFLNKTTNDLISQLNYGYGLNNNFTLLSGINISENYNSFLLGAAINSGIGGMNFKFSSSQAKVFSEKFHGQQYSFDYRYNFDKYDFGVFLNALHQSESYLTVSNTFSRLNYEYLTDSEQKNYRITNNLKDQISINFMKNKFFNNSSSFSLGYSKNTYWDRAKDAEQFNISYSNLWNKIGYTLGYSQTDYSSFNEDDKTFYLSFSLPLDWRKSKLFLTSNIQTTQNDNNFTTGNVNLSGSFGELNNFNFGAGILSTYYHDHAETSIQANANYLLPKVSLGATVFATDDKQQYSFSAKGALVAHKYGITLVNTLADTYTIVHVENGGGARLNNAWGVKLDRFGNAIYPTSSAYNENDISVNPQDLPIDVVLESNQIKVIPRKYSSTLAIFNAKQTSNILLRIIVPNDVKLPIGSQILKNDGSVLGMMGQSNQVILENRNDVFEQPLKVLWGTDMNQSCAIDPIPPLKAKPTKKNYHFEILNVECH